MNVIVSEDVMSRTSINLTELYDRLDTTASIIRNSDMQMDDKNYCLVTVAGALKLIAEVDSEVLSNTLIKE